jgi:hypothetical protein
MSLGLVILYYSSTSLLFLHVELPLTRVYPIVYIGVARREWTICYLIVILLTLYGAIWYFWSSLGDVK